MIETPTSKFPDNLQEQVNTSDINSLLFPQKFARSERFNVSQPFVPQQINPGQPASVQIYNSGKGTNYVDLRDSYFRFDISAVNPIAEVPFEGRISIRSPSDPNMHASIAEGGVEPGAMRYTLEFFGYTIAPTNAAAYLASTTNAALAVDIQALFDSVFPGLTITAMNPNGSLGGIVGQNPAAADSSAFRYQISGFSNIGFDIPTSQGMVLSLSNFWARVGGSTELAPRYEVLNQGTAATPRLVFNSASVIESNYIVFGATPPTLANAQIYNNIMLLSEDVDTIECYKDERALYPSNGMALGTNARRVVVFPYSLPMLAELIIPSFVRDRLEINLTFAEASKCLVRANSSQSYSITNLQYNYYKLGVDPMVDEVLYQKALQNQLIMSFHGVQSGSRSYQVGQPSMDLEITYSFNHLEKIYVVLINNVNITSETESNKFNRFVRQGVQEYKFTSQPGTDFPRESVKIVNNGMGDAKMEYLRTIPLPLIKRKFNEGQRTTALALLNYAGINPIYSQTIASDMPESFIMAINTNFNAGDNSMIDGQICDSSVAINGQAHFLINQMSAIAAGTAYYFLYYCGKFIIKNDMSVSMYL